MDLHNKKVLVTGADGFIGSHLVEELIGKCAHIKALSMYNSFNSWGWLDEVDRIAEVEVISGDVRDPFLCKEIVKDVDVVFHLAALIAIPYSYIAPSSYIDTNVNGTLNMLQATREGRCEAFVHTSTSEVYGTAKYTPIDENHPLQPQSPYSASKIGADMLALSFFNSFELPVVIARPFNTYGPRQSARAIIPTLITQLLNEDRVIRVGDLTPTRDMNYVSDTCAGFIDIAKSSLYGEVINIGSGVENSMEDVLYMIMDILDKKVEVEVEERRLRPSSSEVYRLLCDNTKISILCGYKPRYKLRDGLEKSIEWFSNPSNLKKYKSGIYNV